MLKSKRIKKILFQILIVYLCLVGGLYFAQRALIYFPSKDRPDITPYVKDGVTEVMAQTADGLDLTSWSKQAEDGQPTMVMFHGNASSHIGNLYTLVPYIQLGYGFLSVGYRGYNGNDGKPSEQGFYNDARAAINALKKSGVSESDIVLYGQSIGTGVAVQMALEYPDIKAVILESPYTSLPDVAASTYFFVPVRLLMKDKFDSFAKIKNVSAPLLIMQGLNDRVIAPKFGQKLFDAANEPKEILKLEGYGHNDLPVNIMAAKANDFIND